jgi:hypothetical protein
MLVCLIGFGLTGPATQEKTKKETPRIYELPGGKGLPPYAMIPPPVSPVPSPPKSNTLADIFFYGSGFSLLLNLLNLLEKLSKLISKLLKLTGKSSPEKTKP